MSEASLTALVDEAWRQHTVASGESWLVEPSAPILFFGDLTAFQTSEIRVVTVALNPSRLEFPPGDPFLRFPGISTRGEVDSYIGALGGYFHREPYRSWFGFYDEALQGVGVSYYGAPSGTALHTDVEAHPSPPTPRGTASTVT